MKVIQFIILNLILILMLSIRLNGENRGGNPVKLTNNYVDWVSDDCLSPAYDFEILPELSYFQGFDTVKYKNQSLGFIIDDLSRQYELIESKTFTNWESFTPEDKFDRTGFSFEFKKDDSTAIEINGCVANSKYIIHEKNDSLALNHMLSINSFILEALLLDVKARYNDLKILTLKDSSAIIRPAIIRQTMKYYEKHFPKACNPKVCE